MYIMANSNRVPILTLLMFFATLVSATNTTTPTNTTQIVTTSAIADSPLMNVIRGLPYPLNIYIIYGGVIIPWVICVVVTGILTVLCCLCGYCRRRRNTTHRIIVEPQDSRRHRRNNEMFEESF